MFHQRVNSINATNADALPGRKDSTSTCSHPADPSRVHWQVLGTGKAHRATGRKGCSSQRLNRQWKCFQGKKRRKTLLVARWWAEKLSVLLKVSDEWALVVKRTSV
jgi:hypothetical protein